MTIQYDTLRSLWTWIHQHTMYLLEEPQKPNSLRRYRRYIPLTATSGPIFDSRYQKRLDCLNSRHPPAINPDGGYQPYPHALSIQGQGEHLQARQPCKSILTDQFWQIDKPSPPWTCWLGLPVEVGASLWCIRVHMVEDEVVVPSSVFFGVRPRRR